MNREQKISFVQEIKNNFQDSSAAFVVKVQGLTVKQSEKLRKELRNNGSKLKVVKDRLAKIAIKENDSAKSLEPFLREQVALVFSTKDASATAKLLNDYAKETRLDIVGGLVDSVLFDKNKVVRLASIPSREVLLAQLCGLLNAPVSKVAYAISKVAEGKGGSNGSEQKTESENVSGESEQATAS